MQLFLFNRTLFQGEGLPPSNAVLPTAPGAGGYYSARKGRTTFPFSFALPRSAPSSVSFAGHAALRYTLKATAQVSWEGARSLVAARTDALVVERWTDDGADGDNDEDLARYSEPREGVADTRLFMGGAGQVWLEAGVPRALYAAGQRIEVRCGVKNNTKRHVSGVRLSLARRLIFPIGSSAAGAGADGGASLQPSITEIVHSETFKGQAAYEFAPSHESVFFVPLDVPRDLRTVRKTRLFEVRTVLLVSVLMGTFAKDLTVELPLYIAHANSVRGLPMLLHDAQRDSQQQQRRDRYDAQMDAQMQAVQQFALERGWSPAPVLPPPPPQHPGFARSLERPGSAMAMVSNTSPGGMMIALPAVPQPFSIAHDQLQQQQQGMSPVHPHPQTQLAWDPATAQQWTLSKLIIHSPTVGGHVQPEHAAQQIQRSMSAAPNMMRNQQHQPIALSDSASGFAQGAPGPMLLPQRPGSALSMHGGYDQQQQQHHLQMQLAGSHSPAPPTPELSQSYSSTSPSPIHSFSPPSPSPATYQPIAVPVLSQASPTLQQAQQQQAMLPQGLATIVEDSESQAGTVKSVRAVHAGATHSHIKKTGALGGGPGPAGGGSVSKNDIDAFERMAAQLNEGEEEEMKSALRSAGLEWDEQEAERLRREQEEKEAQESRERQRLAAEARARAQNDDARAAAADASRAASKALSSPAGSRKEEAASLMTARPRASDIFAQTNAAPALEAGTPTSRAPSSVLQQPVAVKPPNSKSPRSSRVAPAAQPPAPEQRRSLPPSPAGKGLSSLEERLSRPTSPSVAVPAPLMALANVAPPAPPSKTLTGEQHSAATEPPAAAFPAASQTQESEPTPAPRSRKPVKVIEAQHAAPAPAAEVEQRQLRSTAVRRIDDWLSSTPASAVPSERPTAEFKAVPAAAVPTVSSAALSASNTLRAKTAAAAAFIDSPRTPAASAFLPEDKLSPSKFEALVQQAEKKYAVVEEDDQALQRERLKRQSLPARSQSSSGAAVAGDGRQRMVSDVKPVQDETSATPLSPDLRSLIDNTKPSGQRSGGNILKDHPITRRLSMDARPVSQHSTTPASPAADKADTAESPVRKLSQKFGGAQARTTSSAGLSLPQAPPQEPAKAPSPSPPPAKYASSPGAMTLLHRPDKIKKSGVAPQFLNRAAPKKGSFFGGVGLAAAAKSPDNAEGAASASRRATITTTHTVLLAEQLLGSRSSAKEQADGEERKVAGQQHASSESKTLSPSAAVVPPLNGSSNTSRHVSVRSISSPLTKVQDSTSAHHSLSAASLRRASLSGSSKAGAADSAEAGSADIRGRDVQARQAKVLAALAADAGDEGAQKKSTAVSTIGKQQSKASQAEALDADDLNVGADVGGRGTTKAIGKSKMSDLRSLWGS